MPARPWSVGSRRPNPVRVWARRTRELERSDRGARERHLEFCLSVRRPRRNGGGRGRPVRGELRPQRLPGHLGPRALCVGGVSHRRAVAIERRLPAQCTDNHVGGRIPRSLAQLARTPQSYEGPQTGACASDQLFRGARCGAREGNRTLDLRITSALLCRLSYPGLCF